ncbi:MAG: hypothetical protein QOG10_1832 [Kribbellaceae bacterium]|jgi:hypothetical protein|nr:hypothetical protein [Kribbellaceae bacterium]
MVAPARLPLPRAPSHWQSILAWENSTAVTAPATTSPRLQFLVDRLLT